MAEIEGGDADKTDKVPDKAPEQTEIQETKPKEAKGSEVDLEAIKREAKAEAKREAKRELEAEKKRIADEQAKATERAKMEEADRLKAEKAELEAAKKAAEDEVAAAKRQLDLHRRLASAKLQPAEETATPLIERAYADLIAGGVEPDEAMKRLRKDYGYLFSRPVEAAPKEPAKPTAEAGKPQGGTTTTAAKQNKIPELPRPPAGSSWEAKMDYVRRKQAANAN